MKSTIAIAATLMSLVALGATSAAQAETTIRLHTWASPKHLINSEILPGWKAAVEDATFPSRKNLGIGVSSLLKRA